MLDDMRVASASIRQPDRLPHLVEAAQGARLQIGDRWVLNFASASYLGLSRDRRILRALSEGAHQWGLSLGMPRSLATPRLTIRLEAALARLVEQDAAMIFPSTSHIAVDVLPLLTDQQGMLLLDDWAYSISWDGARAAHSRGSQVRRFPHNDVIALEHMLRLSRRSGKTLVVCDGVYSAGGHVAALNDIAEVAHSYGALVYVDDAHGIGVLGKNPSRDIPYGLGGGGTPLQQNVQTHNLVHVGSLSKAFSIPLAFIAGPSQLIARLRARSAAMVHCSPPALPLVAAALSALQVNEFDGDIRRRHLLEGVRQLRHGLQQASVELYINSTFPIQTLYFADPSAASRLAQQVWNQGIWSLPQIRPRDNVDGSALRLIITAYHKPADIEEASAVLISALQTV